MAGPRALVSVVCALVLAAPAEARAADPPTDELTPQAQEHVTRAVEAMKRSAYADAEASFMRAAFFTPNWRPLHFNLAVAAEAQGKLGVAIREYEAFKPLARPDEALLADQRISELNERILKFRRGQRSRLVAGAVITSVGFAAAGGGGALVGLYAADSSPYNGKTGFIVGGAQLILYGSIIGLGGVAVLVSAVKARRKLDGLALGPTRLRWAGGAAQLRF
ncbi:MAG: hypothetical protein JNL82_24620 [Myxococcales bacterium]|nr:hypothetical protein [Myxococcales bacterium]